MAISRRCSKPVNALTSVPSTTATSTAGTRGASLRSPSIRAMAPTPIASVGRCVWPSCASTSATSARKKLLRPIDTPSILFSCDSAMMIAAAFVKPTITGCDRKLTTAPRRNTPSASCITPTISVSRMASATKDSEPGAANCASVALVSSETMATGPVASCWDDPHIAPMITGRKAAYRP